MQQFTRNGTAPSIMAMHDINYGPQQKDKGVSLMPNVGLTISMR